VIEMSIWQEQLPQGKWLIGVQGRLDQSQTPELETQLNTLLDNNQYHLVIDLTEVNYVNSGGLRCLVGVWRKAKQQNGDVVLCGLNSRVQEIFAMVGFDKVFQIFPDRHQALQIENKT
jgi:anti-sigma B factor antagonist